MNFPSFLLNFLSTDIVGLCHDTQDNINFYFSFSWYILPFKPKVTRKRPFLLTTNACVPELLPGSSRPARILMRTSWREISELCRWHLHFLSFSYSRVLCVIKLSFLLKGNHGFLKQLSVAGREPERGLPCLNEVSLIPFCVAPLMRSNHVLAEAEFC